MKKMKSLCMLSAALTIALSTHLMPIPAAAAQATASPAASMSHMNLHQAAPPYLQSANWDPDAKSSINDFLKQYGKQSPNYDKKNKPYATLDFDNTTSSWTLKNNL